MKKICMIAVGGTIASVETKEGLRPEITSEEILTYIPEVSKLCQIDAIQLFNMPSIGRHWFPVSRKIMRLTMALS